MTDDFFCDEVFSGKTQVEIVAETEEVLAFHHTRPSWPVHIMVIPKRHIPSLTNLGEHSIDIVHEVLEAVREIADHITKEHGACRVVTNLGQYQHAKHLHFHVTFGERLSQLADT